jgi:hypothetical protein
MEIEKILQDLVDSNFCMTICFRHKGEERVIDILY